MSELRLNFSKAGAKKGLAMAMAFATAFSSMGLSSMTTFASGLGATNPLGEESGGEESTGEESRGEEFNGVTGTNFSFCYDTTWQKSSYGNDYELRVDINQYGFDGSVSGGEISGGGIWSSGNYDASRFSIKWYKLSDEEDVADQLIGEGNYLYDSIFEPELQYYAVVTYYDEEGDVIETLNGKEYGYFKTVEVDYWELWGEINYNFQIARGYQKTLSAELGCDIPENDPNLVKTYKWEKAVDFDAGDEWNMESYTYSVIEGADEASYLSDKAYSMSHVETIGEGDEATTQTSYLSRAIYRETITYKYGNVENSREVYYVMGISNDGLDVTVSDDTVFIPANGSKTVTATATADTDSKITGVWYKDDIPYALAGSGTKKLTASLKITEAGVYDFHAFTKKDTTSYYLNAYSLASAKSLSITDQAELTTGEAYEAEISADYDHSVAIYKYTPEYCTIYYYSMEGTIENSEWLDNTIGDVDKEVDINIAFYDASGERIANYIYYSSNAESFSDFEVINKWDPVKFNDTEQIYMVVETSVPYLSPDAPEDAEEITVDYTLDILPDFDSLCEHYRYTHDTVGGRIKEDDFVSDEMKDYWIEENTFTENYKKATTKTNGYTGDYVCRDCGKVMETGTAIKAIKGITLGKTSVVYTGKDTTNSVVVKDTAGKVISSDNYTVEYSNNKNIGTATVTVTFDDYCDYEGTLKATYSIIPKTTTGLSLTAASKGFTAKWTKDSAVTGYEVQYATASSFKSAKTVSITKNSTVTAKVTKLTASKKYYVRVRSYKTVSGKKVYSAWSAAKTVTTKK